MAEIIPAITPHNFSELREKLELVSHHVPFVHIDITNSTLTRNSTWPYNGSEEDFNEIKNEREGLPHWEDLNFEAHLMVKEPEKILPDWISAGVERAIVHFEALDMDLSEMKEKFYDIELGLGVNLETPIEKILPHILGADFIHLMSISEIGEGGHKFESRIFDKIRELKSELPSVIISVDGGVNLDNAEELFEVGASRLIVNSAIFEADDPEGTLEDFLDTAHDFNR